MEISLARSDLERLQRASRMHYDHRAMKTIPKKSAEMLLDLPTLGIAVEYAAMKAAYCLPMPDPRNLGTGHNRILARADKVYHNFSMIKDRVTLWHTFGKNRIVIPTRE